MHYPAGRKAFSPVRFGISQTKFNEPDGSEPKALLNHSLSCLFSGILDSKVEMKLSSLKKIRENLLKFPYDFLRFFWGECFANDGSIFSEIRLKFWPICIKRKDNMTGFLYTWYCSILTVFLSKQLG